MNNKQDGWKGYYYSVRKKHGVKTRCVYCHSDKKLEVHHIKGGNVDDRIISTSLFKKRHTVILCGKCHDEVHKGRKGRFGYIVLNAIKKNKSKRVRRMVS